MRIICCVILASVCVPLSLNASSNNTCLPVLQSTVDQITELNRQIAIGLGKVDAVVAKADELKNTVDRGINKTVPDILNTLNRAIDLIDSKTNVGLLVGGAVAITAGCAITGAIVYTCYRKTREGVHGLIHHSDAAQGAVQVPVPAPTSPTANNLSR
ncbi:MAG: hypothetical protein V4534_00955 [Myxococcota bacterium]